MEKSNSEFMKFKEGLKDKEAIQKAIDEIVVKKEKVSNEIDKLKQDKEKVF